jgi:putative flavoprotein involved in K+ transport
MRERYDTVVIGGGQAGLAMSYHLRERGREHVILERRRVAERWRSERWNSLHFQSPNWSLKLPGFEYHGDHPQSFARHGQVTKFIEDYSLFIAAPVRCGVEVTSVSQEADSRFLIDTNDEAFEAARVVVATGPFQQPSIPGCSADLPPDIFQVHASRYLSPDQLPPGAVLVVGSGASGCQIAEDLRQDGRTVYLSVSRHRRAPRRYRGRDIVSWMRPMGRYDTRIDSFPERRYPPPMVITGVKGGYDINVRQFAADGIIVLGRLEGAAGSILSFGDDAEEVLAESDKAFLGFKQAIDGYVHAEGIDAPAEESVDAASDFRPIEPIPEVDIREVNITSVVWGTGYGYDYNWLKVPVLNPRGAPIQNRGVTDCPNLFFLGLHWMHTLKSGLLFGVGDDAAYLADYMHGGSKD